VAKAKKKKIVTVSDLAEESGMEGRKIRVVIRGLGMKAPAVEGAEGFGPRAKYEWAEGSKDLTKIRKALKEVAAKAEADEATPKKGKGKKKGRQADPEPDDDEDEDEEDEDDEDLDEDDEDDE